MIWITIKCMIIYLALKKVRLEEKQNTNKCIAEISVESGNEEKCLSGLFKIKPKIH